MPRWPSPAATALAAATTGIHLALGLAMAAPIIQPDEAGQLTAARFLVGQGAPPQADWFPAYSAVLAPVARLASGPLELWRGALIVNAVLAGVTVLLAAALAHRLAPDMSEGRRLTLVAVVAAYPALVLWSNLAVAENLLLPAFLAVVLLVGRAMDTDGAARWAVAGAVAGAAAGAHPRAVAIPVAIVVSTLLLPRTKGFRATFLRAAAVLAGAAPVIAAGWLVIGRGDGRGPGAALEIDRLTDLPVVVAGQVWYLTVASWGLFPLGMATALGALVALVRRGHADSTETTVSFVGVTAVAMLVLGALYLRDDGSLDALVYGRAVEGVVVPVLLVGLIGLLRRATMWRADRSSWKVLARPLAVVAGTLAVTGAALAVGTGAGTIALPVVRTNILGIDWLLTWRDLVLSVGLFSAVALLGAAAMVLASRRLPIAAAGLAGLLFVPSIVTGQDFMVGGSRQRATERAVADAVSAIGSRLGGVPGKCVGYDLAGSSSWHRANYELFLGDVRVRNFASVRSQRPCSALAISGRTDFATAFPGSRRVMLENGYDQVLWALPGPLLDELARSGWLLPDRLPSPVPPADRRYQVTLSDTSSAPRAIAMRRGARYEVEVTITHAGTAEPWPNTHGLQSQFQAVRVGVRWYRLGKPGLPDGHPSLDETRVELPRTLFPGERATIRVPLEAVRPDGRPLRAGTYQARVEVVQNGVAWFEPVGPPLILDVVVVGRIF